MTFELLKVCRQANPAWIELRVMYVKRTVTGKRNETKRNEINQNETKRNEINEMETK
jgi:hypothetical protein